MKHQQGYILIVVLLILSLAMMLVTNLYRQGFVQLKFDKLMVDREQARLLAYSGIECARSELMYKPAEKDEKASTAPSGTQSDTTDKAAPKTDPNAALKRLIPVMNRWQTFNLKKEIDGLNGSIKICVMSESGKIPLNMWFDVKQRKFLNEGKDSGDMKVYMQQLCAKLKSIVGDKDLFAPLEKYLKNKDTYIQDITQLLKIKEFQEAFWGSQFYEPPSSTDSAKRPVYLMDLFTLWGASAQMSVWYLSDSVLAALGLKRVQANDVEQRAKLLTALFSKEPVPTDLKELWTALFKDLYGKDFSALPPGSDKVLKTEFDSKVFSVLSYGTVGKVTYKLYGILQQVEKGEEKEYKLIHLYAL